MLIRRIGVYTHSYDGGEALEVITVWYNTQAKTNTRKHTLSTFSWLQGQFYPGFGVLSLPLPRLPNGPQPTFNTCPLAPQIWIYVVYIVLLVVTIIVSFVRVSLKPRRNEYVSLPLWRLDRTDEEVDGEDDAKQQRIRVHWMHWQVGLRNLLEVVAFVLFVYILLLLLVLVVV